MLAAKIPKQCCSNQFTKYARVLIQVVMMMQHHVLEWVSHLQSPTVTWREKKSIFKPLSSFAPVTNLLVPSRAMGASNLFKKVCHHFPTSITWWETANLVCITNTDCRRWIIGIFSMTRLSSQTVSESRFHHDPPSPLLALDTFDSSYVYYSYHANFLRPNLPKSDVATNPWVIQIAVKHDRGDSTKYVGLTLNWNVLNTVKASVMCRAPLRRRWWKALLWTLGL